jgi:hypothetical protein
VPRVISPKTQPVTGVHDTTKPLHPVTFVCWGVLRGRSELPASHAPPDPNVMGAGLFRTVAVNCDSRTELHSGNTFRKR